VPAGPGGLFAVLVRRRVALLHGPPDLHGRRPCGHMCQFRSSAPAADCGFGTQGLRAPRPQDSPIGKSVPGMVEKHLGRAEQGFDAVRADPHSVPRIKQSMAGVISYRQAAWLCAVYTASRINLTWAAMRRHFHLCLNPLAWLKFGPAPISSRHATSLLPM